MKLRRILKHTLVSRWLVKKYFSKSDLQTLAHSIAESEKKHRAEIRIAIQANLELFQLIKKY